MNLIDQAKKAILDRKFSTVLMAGAISYLSALGIKLLENFDNDPMAAILFAPLIFIMALIAIAVDRLTDAESALNNWVVNYFDLTPKIEIPKDVDPEVQL